MENTRRKRVVYVCVEGQNSSVRRHTHTHTHTQTTTRRIKVRITIKLQTSREEEEEEEEEEVVVEEGDRGDGGELEPGQVKPVSWA